MLRYVPLLTLVAILLASVFVPLSPWLLSVPILLLAIAIWDYVQTKHSLRRNYPLVGHLRAAAESIRPQIRQYWVESDTDGRPFDREQRDLVYQRAKGARDTMPFGTEREVNGAGFQWLNHSISPQHVDPRDLRLTIGGDACKKPYSASLLNVSAMSFGALSAAAIRALNKGARQGGFAHDTGEGGLSPYHLEHGGDIIWEIGSGYFGCRTAQGEFDPDQFTAKATLDAVKMIEVKLSQGAKPGHGGVLPAVKVSEEIARTRGVPAHRDCISPASHSAFHSPLTLLGFLDVLRGLSGGKPVGFKLCLGHKWEFLGIVKAMLQAGVYPDFIVVDGKEGGTGAAPVEFVDHVGTPLLDGLTFVQRALVGAGLRERIRLGASGKVVSGFDMALCMAVGADWCNSARGFMFSLGCLQSQKCHTNRCPVGVATQDHRRQRGLHVAEKSVRVASFHQHTVQALADLTGAAGLQHPRDFDMEHFILRPRPERLDLSGGWPALQPGELLGDSAPARWADLWQRANAEAFTSIAGQGPVSAGQNNVAQDQ